MRGGDARKNIPMFHVKHSVYPMNRSNSLANFLFMDNGKQRQKSDGD